MIPLPGFQKPMPYFWDAEERNSKTSYTRPTIISDLLLPSVARHKCEPMMREGPARTLFVTLADSRSWAAPVSASIRWSQWVDVGTACHNVPWVCACAVCVCVLCVCV